MDKDGLPPAPCKRLVKTALHQAVLDLRLHQVRLLVERHGLSVDSRDVHGRTPLMLACLIDNAGRGLKMASIFLKAGAYLNARDAMGRTALIYACMNGRQDIVRSILKKDFMDINQPDNDGNAAIHHAAINGNPSVVGLLAEAYQKFELQIDRRNKLGYTPLLLACKNGNYVSAYNLLSITKASPILRDREFNLNASEWIQRAHEAKVKLRQRSLLTSAPPGLSPSSPLSFRRQYTMYQTQDSPCRHFRHCRSQQQAPTSYLEVINKRIPDNVPPVLRKEESSENLLNGQDAREALLQEIENVESKLSPKIIRNRLSHPSSAKLLALCGKKQKAAPLDMVTLFKLYSEQYQSGRQVTGQLVSL